MSKSQIQIFTDYIPAQFYEGKRCYIGYYVKNPSTGELERKCIKFNRIKSKALRRNEAKRVINEINRKLQSGWNPYKEESAPKGYVLLKDTFNTYINIKKKESRANTLRSYTSYLNVLKTWMEKKGIYNNIYVINFSKAMASEFMNQEYTKEHVGEVNFNNKLAFYKIFWRWLIENSYAANNPFEGITKKKEKSKSRIQFIEQSDREKLREYFYSDNRQYYILCMLAFHCLIRPGELSNLKMENINLKEQYIFIPGKFGKNKKDRFATIPDVLIDEIIWILQQEHHPNHYIFSSHFMKPGKEKLDPRRIAKTWNKMRVTTKIDKSIQFYSLRDTGIIQKLRDGITPDEVMYQADHSSLEVTNKYVKIAKPRVLENVKNLASKF